MGVLETSFEMTVSTAVPPGIPAEKVIAFLRDGYTVTSLSENWLNTERRDPPEDATQSTSEAGAQQEVEYYEVEEQVPIPKWLWPGSQKYTVDFFPLENGCDYKIKSGSLFSSTNHWRVLRGQVLDNGEVVLSETEDSRWFVQTVAISVTNRALAAYLKGQFPRGTKAILAKILDKLQGTVS